MPPVHAGMEGYRTRRTTGRNERDPPGAETMRYLPGEKGTSAEGKTMRRSISDEEIRDLYRQGWFLHQIVTHKKVSVRTIRKALDAEGMR